MYKLDNKLQSSFLDFNQPMESKWTQIYFTKLEDIHLTSNVLSVFVASIGRMQNQILSVLFYLLDILKFREGWLPVYAG